MESRKGDARRDPLEGEPEQSYGTREEFHVVIPQAFPEHLLCDLYGSASQRAECAVLCLVTQSCLTLCNPMDNSPPESSWRFSRQEYWSGLSCPSPGDFPTQGLNLCFLHQQADSLPPLHHLGNRGHHHLSIISSNKMHVSGKI